METPKNCPKCGKPPAVEVNSGRTTLYCAAHQYIGQGATLEEAIKDWNRFIAMISHGK
ncbi:MAG: hypothetical protein ACLQUR_04840 [Limisphaerales bacterium]